MTSEVSSTENGSKDSDFFISAEELENLYLLLETGNIPDLDWQNPGRRTPSPDETHKVEQSAAAEPSETQEPAKTDFDFDDDIAQPQMRVVRNQNSTPKSAKKKTAVFAGVMETLKKKNAEAT